MTGDLQDWGWRLFIVSALGFLGAALRDGDWLVGCASLAFLIACVLFVLDRRR